MGLMAEDRNKAARELSVHTALGRAFQHHDREIGAKMSATLRIWYEQVVRPLEQRIAWLELPWPVRLWLRGKRLISHAWHIMTHLPEKMPWRKKTSAPST